MLQISTISELLWPFDYVFGCATVELKEIRENSEKIRVHLLRSGDLVFDYEFGCPTIELEQTRESSEKVRVLLLKSRTYDPPSTCSTIKLKANLWENGFLNYREFYITLTVLQLAWK